MNAFVSTVSAEVEQIGAAEAAQYLRESLAVTDPDVCIPLDATPSEVAEIFLKSHRKNRTINQGTVDGYAAVMRRGEWSVTGQGLGFDANGVLQDGQHRLLAIIKAGVEVTILVTRGLDPSVFSKYDNGRRRNLAQIIGIDLNVTTSRGLGTLASITNLMYRCATGHAGTGHNTTVTNEEGREFLRLNPDIANYVEMAMKAQKQTGLVKSAAGVAFYLTERSPRYADVSDEEWAEWYGGFIDHLNLPQGDVRHMLHSRLKTIQTTVSQNARPYVGMAYYLKALDYHFSDKTCRTLRMGESESQVAAVAKAVRELAPVNLPEFVTPSNAA